MVTKMVSLLSACRNALTNSAGDRLKGSGKTGQKADVRKSWPEKASEQLGKTGRTGLEKWEKLGMSGEKLGKQTWKLFERPGQLGRRKPEKTCVEKIGETRRKNLGELRGVGKTSKLQVRKNWAHANRNTWTESEKLARKRGKW